MTIVLGSGAFGTAMAQVLADQGEPLALLGRDWKHQAESLHGPVLLAVPAQVHGEVMAELDVAGPVFTLAKGIDLASGRLLSQLYPQLGFISGPSFAADLMAGLPTALTIAHPDLAVAKHWAAHWSGRQLRLYPTDDCAGVALCGAMKNVIAIACGTADGMGLGASASAALLARGLAEINRLNSALGGRSETLLGLAGVGDLALSCTSTKSRNFRFGQALGRQLPPDGLLAEGVPTTRAALKLATRHGVELPITQAVGHLLDGQPAIQVVTELLARPTKTES